MENSPPGIQTIPAGVSPAAESGLGTVVANAEAGRSRFAAAADLTGGVAISDGRMPRTMIHTTTAAPSSKPASRSRKKRMDTEGLGPGFIEQFQRIRRSKSVESTQLYSLVDSASLINPHREIGSDITSNQSVSAMIECHDYGSA